MVRPNAAYGLFYLENRPILLRAVEMAAQPTPALLEAAREAGFNAVRPAREGLVDEALATEYGLAIVGPDVVGRSSPPLLVRPFGAAAVAQRAAARASETAPAAVWGLPAEPAVLLGVVARGARGYSVVAPPEAWPTLARLHRWLAAGEEELTASVAVHDALVCLESPGAETLLEGGFAVLALAGYNPPFVDLIAAEDADLAEFPAALFPCSGALEIPDYGKLVVLTLRGATLVTYPQPVQRTADGIAYRTTFLWPPPSRNTARARGAGQRALGRRVQVRDGVSTLITEVFGEPYTGPPYFRLPAGQRVAHRDLTLSLFGEVVQRALEPDRALELELVARLSPDGGALLFIMNRLDAQSGHVRLADLPALRLAPDFVVSVEFAGSGSTGHRERDGIHVTLAPRDALVLRLG